MSNPIRKQRVLRPTQGAGINTPDEIINVTLRDCLIPSGYSLINQYNHFDISILKALAASSENRSASLRVTITPSSTQWDANVYDLGSWVENFKSALKIALCNRETGELTILSSVITPSLDLSTGYPISITSVGQTVYAASTLQSELSVSDKQIISSVSDSAQVLFISQDFSANDKTEIITPPPPPEPPPPPPPPPVIAGTQKGLRVLNLDPKKTRMKLTKTFTLTNTFVLIFRADRLNYKKNQDPITVIELKSGSDSCKLQLSSTTNERQRKRYNITNSQSSPESFRVYEGYWHYLFIEKTSSNALKFSTDLNSYVQTGSWTGFTGDIDEIIIGDEASSILEYDSFQIFSSTLTETVKEQIARSSNPANEVHTVNMIHNFRFDSINSDNSISDSVTSSTQKITFESSVTPASDQLNYLKIVPGAFEPLTKEPFSGIKFSPNQSADFPFFSAEIGQDPDKLYVPGAIRNLGLLTSAPSVLSEIMFLRFHLPSGITDANVTALENSYKRSVFLDEPSNQNFTFIGMPISIIDSGVPNSPVWVTTLYIAGINSAKTEMTAHVLNYYGIRANNKSVLFSLLGNENCVNTTTYQATPPSGFVNISFGSDLFFEIKRESASGQIGVSGETIFSSSATSNFNFSVSRGLSFNYYSRAHLGWRRSNPNQKFLGVTIGDYAIAQADLQRASSNELSSGQGLFENLTPEEKTNLIFYMSPSYPTRFKTTSEIKRTSSSRMTYYDSSISNGINQGTSDQPGSGLRFTRKIPTLPFSFKDLSPTSKSSLAGGEIPSGFGRYAYDGVILASHIRIGGVGYFENPFRVIEWAYDPVNNIDIEAQNPAVRTNGNINFDLGFFKSKIL